MHILVCHFGKEASGKRICVNTELVVQSRFFSLWLVYSVCVYGDLVSDCVSVGGRVQCLYNDSFKDGSQNK